jgi:hypothetical protein
MPPNKLTSGGSAAAWIAGVCSIIVALIAGYATINSGQKKPKENDPVAKPHDGSTKTEQEVAASSTKGNSSPSVAIQGVKDSDIKIDQSTKINQTNNSVWGFINAHIEQDWRTKPRQDLIAAVVRLRDAMQRCHGSYEKYVSAYAKADLTTKAEGKLSPEAYNEWRNWENALSDLKRSLGQLNKLLTIFGPAASESLTEYLGDDEAEWHNVQETLRDISQETGRSNDINVRGVSLGADFTGAMTQLDKFIMDHFKTEEIYDALQKSSPAEPQESAARRRPRP